MFKRRNVDLTKSMSQTSELEALLTTNHVGQVIIYMSQCFTTWFHCRSKALESNSMIVMLCYEPFLKSLLNSGDEDLSVCCLELRSPVYFKLFFKRNFRIFSKYLDTWVIYLEEWIDSILNHLRLRIFVVVFIAFYPWICLQTIKLRIYLFQITRRCVKRHWD